jgi:predicted nuclease of predicted toxin-antitoxin system
VHVKLLLDENISPKVGEQLRADGVDAVGVRERGLLQADDHTVLDKAFAEDRILVTKNVGDFEKLARARDIHAGIVLIEAGDLGRMEQLDILRKVVALLQGERDLVNRALCVSPDGELTFADIPPVPAN